MRSQKDGSRRRHKWRIPQEAASEERRIASTGWRMRAGSRKRCSNLRTQRLLAACGSGVSGQGFRTVNSYSLRMPPGKPRVDDKGMVSLDTDGTGPPLQLDFFGTGFLVASEGRLLTNHHVTEPWWGDEELKQLLDRGAAAFVVSYTAYFPGTLSRHRGQARPDFAACRFGHSQATDSGTASHLTPQARDRNEASVTGDAVVLIGYPTGIEGILARAGSDMTRKVAENAHEVTRFFRRWRCNTSFAQRPPRDTSEMF